MDEEYIRLLNSNKLQELFDCKSGYMDQNDCTWYHENWMILRYLEWFQTRFGTKTSMKKQFDNM